MFGLNRQREGRGNPRCRIDRFLAVYDHDKSTFLGRVLDLSISGMCVLSSETLPIGNHVRFAIEILQEGGAVKTFHLRCRVLWTRPDGEGGLYRIGLEYSGISPTIIEEIERIIREQDLSRSGALPQAHPPG